MLTLVNPLLLPLDPSVEPLQTNRHNNDHLPDTNLMSNVVFERLICFIDSFIEEIGLITSISFHSETLLSLFWD